MPRTLQYHLCCQYYLTDHLLSLSEYFLKNEYTIKMADVQLSHFLARILRHEAIKRRLDVTEGMWYTEIK